MIYLIISIIIILPPIIEYVFLFMSPCKISGPSFELFIYLYVHEKRVDNRKKNFFKNMEYNWMNDWFMFLSPYYQNLDSYFAHGIQQPILKFLQKTFQEICLFRICSCKISIIISIICFVHPIFRFWFLVTFVDKVAKIRKYYKIFVYILQGKMGKTEKTERKLSN